MTEPIKLPPLPRGYTDGSALAYGDVYDDEHMQAYATEAIEPYAKRIADLEAALQSQDREDAYIPEERSNYTPSITDCDAVIAQREGYTEGWNDCRQEAIDRARRVEGDGE